MLINLCLVISHCVGKTYCVLRKISELESFHVESSSHDQKNVIVSCFLICRISFLKHSIICLAIFFCWKSLSFYKLCFSISQ
ncbi:unnamed protein product [Moneuplotes crassus]|uniref:Uncharacterized protein n=1 Tax=Euplotes crassus TaxID=5936 RepID=A0AAD2D259_EUPCR|nr:unnamed protein product [Moneuplotes crassus]